MQLREMVEALGLQDSSAANMATRFDERVRMMAGCAREAKRASGAKRPARCARLRFPDTETGDTMRDGRGIDDILIRETGTCQFTDKSANMVTEGARVR